MQTQAPSPYLTCAHEQTAVRWRVRANGVGAWVLQCLACGAERRQFAKTAPEVRALADRIPFDESLSGVWSQRVQDYWQQRVQQQAQQREQQGREWWRWYNAYLKTPEWRHRRQKVLERAGFLCEGCRERDATQVHHKTYEHAGNELLFELVAVCDTCHHILHPDMERRQDDL